MRYRSPLAWAVCVSLVVGCTLVPLSPEGETVRLATEAEVAGCERRGTTTSTVLSRVGLFPRKEAKVREELATLARNEAAEQGANAVVPESAVEDGRRVFGIYACDGS